MSPLVLALLAPPEVAPPFPPPSFGVLEPVVPMYPVIRERRIHPSVPVAIVTTAVTGIVGTALIANKFQGRGTVQVVALSP